MISFGKRLKELRTEKNITQKAMAEMLNISIPTLSHWECDYQEPAFKDLISLGKFFDVTTDYLLGLEDDFGMRTTAHFMSDTYSAEERKIIEDFRQLDFYGKKLVKQNLETLLEKPSNGVLEKNRK